MTEDIWRRITDEINFETKMNQMAESEIRRILLKRKINQAIYYYLLGEINAQEAAGEVHAAVDIVSAWRLNDPLPGWWEVTAE